MFKLGEVYYCWAKVLSPVHIGSGESYNASEYFKAKLKSEGNLIDVISRINISNYYLSLNDKKKNDFLRGLSDPDFDLSGFDRKIPKDFRRYLAINESKFDIPANKMIDENIKTLDKAYIPGTSIKGAIKSSILYRLIDDELIKDISRNVLDNGNVIKDKYYNFMSNIFSTKFIENGAQGDIMKFIRVSDSNTIKRPSVHDVVTVMASFREGHYEFYSRNNREKYTISFLETIPVDTKLSFNIINGYSDLIHKKSFENKKHLIDIDYIKKSIFIFSRSLINNELEFADKYNMDCLYDFYSEIKELNTLESPLLKIGAGSGYLATTVNLKIKKYNPDLFEEIADGTQYTNYDYEFPKSRKITYNGGKPLGWIKLSFKED